MAYLTQSDLRCFLLTLRELYAYGDLEHFPAHVLSVLPQLVSAEMFGYTEVNPQQHRATGLIQPLGEIADARRTFALYAHEHPVIRHFQQTHDDQALAISDFLTQRQFHRLGLYNEFYRRFGLEDQLAITLPAPQSIVIGITLNRDWQGFSERDRLTIDLLRPHLRQAYQNALAATRMQQGLVRLGRLVAEEWDRGVIILTRDGQPRVWTERARRWVAEYFGQFRHARCLPEPLQRWVLHQCSLLSQTGNVPSPLAPLTVDKHGKRLVVRLLTEPGGDRYLLLLEEQPPPLSAGILAQLGLTPRETEVLFWVIQGKTNLEIGIILEVRSRTVHKHLERIYGKLGVETRTAAARQALETLGLLKR